MSPVLLGGHLAQCWHLPSSHRVLLISPHWGKNCSANCLEPMFRNSPKKGLFSEKWQNMLLILFFFSLTSEWCQQRSG